MGRAAFDFTGRVALVTGGARNIGRAIVAAFLAAGARVVLADRDAAALEAARAALGAGPDRLAPVAADVAEEASVARLVAAALAAFGRLDVIVNNAGLCTLNLATDLTVEEWDGVLAVNLRGPWLLAKHGAPRMAAGGAIVNIASQAAQRAQRFTAHYSASKMGLIGLTRALAVELAPRIRVNAVSPGTVETEMIGAEIAWRVARGHDRDAGAVRQDWLARIPMGRFQPPEAIARAVLFLASEAAGETTGETLNVSGGAVMV